ncbi:MAG: glycosyltransferase family 2 protein [Burkholderiales bacterium]|nr:glycosyltransferase family 2 protein [Burkholderiales bacterium]
MKQQPVISISIVSHQQGALVAALLQDIAAHCAMPLEVILTLNQPEALPFDVASFPFPVKIVSNVIPKGFGANHNAAFALTGGAHFCVLNPDIRITQDPLPALIELLADQSVGAVAPLIVNTAGGIEDSARKFPTPAGILKKAWFGSSALDYGVGEAVLYPDWIAGMFIMFRAETFRAAGGFDEGYFLYYEDVDLCWRLKREQLRAALLPTVRAIHDARRSSHRRLRYLLWHIKSMLRFFAKRACAWD